MRKLKKRKLRLGEVDLKKKPVTPKMFLCMPNKVEIGKLSEAYDINLSLKLTSLNELTFTIPQFVEHNHMMIRNHNADTIKGRYLIKLVLGYYTEYYIINNITKVGSDTEEVLQISALSLAFELNDKIIRDYSVVSENASKQLNDVLIDTNWTVGYIDSEFDLKFRGIDISSNTVQEIVVQIAETFNALIDWDTEERKVNFYRPENIGLDKGFKVKYGVYLESLNLEDNAEEVITRLKIYGKDDLTIRGVNPLGTTYIEDFSYYLYPFERDVNRNVISHSGYMSDELCHAILDYNDLLKSKESDFELLRAKKAVHESNMTDKQNLLFEYETSLAQDLDTRDSLNSQIAFIGDEYVQYQNSYDREYGEPDPSVGQVISDDLNQKINDRNNILIAIDNLRGLINGVNSEITAIDLLIDDVDSKINELKSELSIPNNFSTELIKERNLFIIEKEWSNDNIDDEEDLLKEGKLALKELMKQKITLNIDVVNFLAIVTEQHNWDKLNLGDTIKIEHERLRLLYNAKITGIEFDFENASINIEISNVSDLETKDAFEKMIYQSYGASTQVSLDKWKWDLSLENNGAINDIINNEWDANKQSIVGAKDQVIEISDRGLLIKDPRDPMTYLVALNSMISITGDGGNTWKTALTSKGLVAETVYGKIIMGVNLAIEDIDGVLKFQGSKGQIFNRYGELVMKMGLISDPGKSDEFGLTAFNDVTKVTMSDTVGFSIEKATGTGWEKIFWADQSDGTIYGKNLVVQNIKVTNDIGKEILNAETGYFDIGAFKTIVADGKLTSIEKLQIISELNKIYSNYQLLLNQASDYIHSTRDNIFDITSQNLNISQSGINRFSTSPLTNAYNALINYISTYVKVKSNIPLVIDVNDPLTESTSEIADRTVFILKFQNYYAEADRLRNAIEDAIYYTGMNMGQFYNNIIMGEFGFIALRNDNNFRAYLNATNGLALQRWTGSYWENIMYADMNGTLMAEDLVANRLILKNGGDVLIDGYNKIIDFSKFTTILGQVFADNINAYGLQILNRSTDEVMFEVDDEGNVTINTVDPDSNNRTFMRAGYLEVSGTYTRTWDVFTGSGGNTQTSNVALRFQNGYFRARNNTLNRSLYYSDFGISTMIDGSGSGAIEFFSNVFNTTANGVTISANNGNVALVSKASSIYIAPEWENKGHNVFSFQIVDGDTASDTDGLIYYGSNVNGYKSALRMDKSQAKVYVTDGTGSRGTGSMVVDSLLSYNGKDLTLKVDGSNYIKITSSGIKIVGTRIDLN